MRVAVTGASGFVGGAVVADAVARGHEVLALSRRPVELPGAEWRRWDLTEGPLTDAPEVDVVVHAAARVGERGSWAQFERANVAGTAAVLDAFPGARLVHVSSGSVYDPYIPTVDGREDEAPVARYLGSYAASKAAAERLVRERAPGHAGGAVILRPHAVYGPGDTTLLPRIESAVRGRRLVLPGDGRVRQSLTHVGNLVAAVRAAGHVDLDARDGGVLVANVADAEPVALRDVLLELLERRGRGDVEILGVPVRVATALAVLAEGAARLDPRGREPRPSRYAISHLALERTLDLTTLRERLGVEPAPTELTGAEDW